MNMYYAVKNGRIPGIYETWGDCQAQVNGFSNAKFHKFKTYDEAVNYMGEEAPKIERPHTSNDEHQYPLAYVDGSYNVHTGEYSYGVVMIPEKDAIKIEFGGKDTKFSSMRNVAGECLGVIEALKMADKIGIKELHIYHDYSGLSHWIDRTWNAGVQGVQDYVQQVDSCLCRPIFHKVEAHTGVELNELVDSIAKKQLGI